MTLAASDFDVPQFRDWLTGQSAPGVVVRAVITTKSVRSAAVPGAFGSMPSRRPVEQTSATRIRT